MKNSVYPGQGRTGAHGAYDGGMLEVSASHCGRFLRRNDLNVFNMSDYMSCENCRHNTAENGCRAKANTPFSAF